MEFAKDIILESDIVQLRPLTSEDFNHLLPYALNEPSLWNYSITGAGGEKNLKHYIQKAMDARAKKDSYPFVVYDKRSKQYAGSTRFYDYQPTHNTVQLGYTWYGSSFQRTGLNRACKLLMLEYAFEELELHRVEFRADADNNRSITAMLNIGCTQEGILRSNCATESGRRDSIILSILRDEWKSHVKQNLVKKIKAYTS